MSRCIPRTVTTHYEAADGTELEITIEFDAAENGRTPPECLTDLDAAGMPADEQPGVIERATALYWAAEHASWLQTPEGEASGL